MKEFTASLSTREGSMDLHGFVPDAPRGRLPAVMVLQEAFGVNAHMKRVCRRVAGLGYAAFSPELFHRAGAGVEFGYEDFAKVRPMLASLTTDRILEDLSVAHRHISRLAYVDAGRMAAWGFCMGGWASVLAACELRLAAAIAFYGGGMVHPREGIGFTPLMDRLGRAGCPLLLVYGGLDQGIPPADIEAVSSGLAAAGRVHVVEIYPDAGHGFFCEDRKAYHRASAEAAWARATSWLAARLA
jgi:carboxymethylenebutenolidase